MGKKSKKTVQTVSPAPSSSTSRQKPVASSKTIKPLWIKIILVVVVLLIYGNSVNYEFTIDDNLFYLKHSSVQKGFSGIPEIFSDGSLEKYNGMKGLQPYRPVTLSSFAIQKQIFKMIPPRLTW